MVLPAVSQFYDLAAMLRSRCFSALLLHFELHGGGLKAQHPLVHPLLHVLGGTDKAHEVDWFCAAPQAKSEAVATGLCDDAARY